MRGRWQADESFCFFFQKEALAGLVLENSGARAHVAGTHNARRWVMAKGKDKGGREKKKPKADKKPAAAATTFMRPMPVGSKPSSKPAKDE